MFKEFCSGYPHALVKKSNKTFENSLFKLKLYYSHDTFNV